MIAILYGLGPDFDMLVTSFEGLDLLLHFFALRIRLLNYEAWHKIISLSAPSIILVPRTHPSSISSPHDTFHDKGHIAFAVETVITFNSTAWIF